MPDAYKGLLFRDGSLGMIPSHGENLVLLRPWKEARIPFSFVSRVELSN